MNDLLPFLGGGLAGAIFSQTVTLFITYDKEKKRRKLVYSNIRDVYQRVFIKEVNNEINTLNQMKQFLENYIKLKKEDRDEDVHLNAYSVFTIFPQSDIMLFCEEYKIKYYQLYEMLKQFELQKPKTSKMILTDFLSKIKQIEDNGNNIYDKNGKYNSSMSNVHNTITSTIQEIDESVKTLQTPVHNSKVLLKQMGIQ